MLGDQTTAPRIYVPEDQDPLRDGLLKGYRDHVPRLLAEERALREAKNPARADA